MKVGQQRVKSTAMGWELGKRTNKTAVDIYTYKCMHIYTYIHVYVYTRTLIYWSFFVSPSLNGINLSKNSIYFTGKKQTQRERGAVRNAALSRWNATPASWTSPPQSPFGAKAARLARWTLNRVSFCGSDGRKKKQRQTEKAANKQLAEEEEQKENKIFRRYHGNSVLAMWSY